MYKFYRKLANGVWKYVDTFNSTLDANYHDHINFLEEEGIEWKLVRTYDKKIMFGTELKTIAS